MPSPVHYKLGPLIPAVCGEDHAPFVSHTDPGQVTCLACRKSPQFLITQQPAKLSTVLKELPIRQQLRRRWTVAVVGGDTDASFEDWLEAGGVGGSGSRPLHTPPYMNESDDNLWIFRDANTPDGEELVVAQREHGHVDLIIGGEQFRLHHLDRMDLVRALLHDFNYSSEVGGPGDDQD